MLALGRRLRQPLLSPISHQRPPALGVPSNGALRPSALLRLSHWDVQENSSLSFPLPLLLVVCHGCAVGEQQQQGAGSWGPAPSSRLFWGPPAWTSLRVPALPALTTGKVSIVAGEPRRETSGMEGRGNWYPRASLLLCRKHCLPLPWSPVFPHLPTGLLLDLHLPALCHP